MQPFPFRPKWKLNPLDLHQRSEERGKLSCYRSCSESSPSLWQNTKFFWHSMTWGSAFLQGLLSKNKANAGQTFTLHTEKKVNTNMRKLKTENTQLYFVTFFQLLLTRPDRAYLLDMTHQCLFSKLRLMMTFKRKSIDLSLHTGINLSFLSSWFDPNQKVPKTVLDTAVLYLATYWSLAGPIKRIF